MNSMESKKLSMLPPYLFIKLDEAKRNAIKEGRDIIDLGIGDPDLPTPRHIIERLKKAVFDPSNHRYPSNKGLSNFRKAIAKWYKIRFGVVLDSDNQIQPLLGSKEGIAHLPFAFLNSGEYTLVPDPSYPPYRNCTILAGGKPFIMPLLEDNDFLPRLSSIPKKVAGKCKIIYINYPNNPTASVANKKFFKDLLQFSRKHNIIIASDLAYSEIAFNGFKPESILEFTKKKDLVVEFHSLSKTYNMTGWRIGWACGNDIIIKEFSRFKSNIDSGIFQAVQIAGISALETSKDFYASINRIYKQRQDVLVDGLNSLGWQIERPKATFYVWTKIPRNHSSSSFSKLILDKMDIVVTPGNGFGKYGEGYIRFALTVNKEKLKKVVERLSKLKI